MDSKDIFQNTKETIRKLVKPEMGEMSKSGTDIWGIGNLPIYNPDDLVEKRIRNLPDYAKAGWPG